MLTRQLVQPVGRVSWLLYVAASAPTGSRLLAFSSLTFLETNLGNPQSGWWISVTSRMCNIIKLDNQYFWNFPAEHKNLKNVQNYSILYKSEAEEWEFLIASLFCWR